MTLYDGVGYIPKEALDFDVATQAELDAVAAQSGNLPLFNVKDYGAKGDGETDDAKAIQEAIDAANTAGGGVVLVPAGIYIVGTTLVIENNITVAGQGEASVIKLKDGANVDVLTTARYGKGDVTAGARDFLLRDFAIDGNKANQTGKGAVLIDGLSYKIENVHIHDTYGVVQAIMTRTDPEENMEAFVSDLRVFNCGGAFEWYGPHDSNLVNVLVRRAGLGACIIASAISSWTNCHTYGNTDYGIVAESGNFVNCQAEGTKKAKVLLIGDGVKWIGGRVFAAGAEDGKIGFEFAAEWEEEAVSSNSAQIEGVEVANCDNGAFKFTHGGNGSIVSGHVYGGEGKSAIVGEPASDIEWRGLIVKSPMVYGDARAQYSNEAAGCCVRLTKDQAIANNFPEGIAWDTDEGTGCYNTGVWEGVTNPDRFTAPVTGVYQLSVSVTWPSAESGLRRLSIVEGDNANNVHAATQDDEDQQQQHVTAMVLLEKGAYLNVYVVQVAGSEKSLQKDAYGEEGANVARASFELIRVG